MNRRGNTPQSDTLPQGDESCERRRHIHDRSGCHSVKWAIGLMLLLGTAGVLLRLPAPAPALESEASRHLRNAPLDALRPAAPVFGGGVHNAVDNGFKEPPYFADPLAKWGGGKPVSIDSKFMYNKELADLMPVDRALPDSRPPGCIARNDAMDMSKLPRTTVVVVSYNEAQSTLRRTVTSVLNHSPPGLLDEIIIVDDCSEWEQAKQVEGMPKTRVIRNEKREGLMIARMVGFAAAKAETVTFLDSHVECIAGWLPPLLQRVGMNSSTVISPVIDIIKEDTLAYVPAGQGMRGIFDWQLTFKWKPDDKVGKDANPYESPTHAGGLFTISKKYFEHLGLYDKGMHVWGYENIELSFRVWMCGGRLEIDPCSRVGHIFRSKSPLKFNGENYQIRNKLRTAAVWLDDYSKRIMGTDPPDYGDISEQIAMRKRLQCHSFQWYLDNVFPDHPVVSHVTTFKHRNRDLCLDTLGRTDEGSKIGLYAYHGPDGNQRFEIDASEESASKIKVEELCLSPAEGETDKLVLLGDCDGPRSRWVTNGKGELRHSASDRCLQIDSDLSHRRLKMVECDKEVGVWSWTCEGKGAKTPSSKGLKEESTGFCVDSMARSSGEPASVWTCHHAGGNQAFSFRDWMNPPAGEAGVPADMPGAQAGLLMNTEQDLCLQVSAELPIERRLKVGNRKNKVILRACSQCDGSAGASSSDCVWWRLGSQLRSRSTQECLRLSKAQDSADLEASSCGKDTTMASWDTSIPIFGLCHGEAGQ